MRPLLNRAEHIINTLRDRYVLVFNMQENASDVDIFARAAYNQRVSADEARGYCNEFNIKGRRTLPYFVIDDFRERIGERDASLV